jgi:predicted RNA-binding protein with PUA-like domain
MKTEPSVYGIEDLERDRTTGWEGVRNYQARNFMRDDMRVGDRVLIYHSQAKPPGLAGVGRVSRTAIPDPTAFDPDSPYFDPKSDPDNPRWIMVEVAFVERFERLLSLPEMREMDGLEDLMVLKKGMRLSIQPVDPEHYRLLVKTARSRREEDSA